MLHSEMLYILTSSLALFIHIIMPVRNSTNRSFDGASRHRLETRIDIRRTAKREKTNEEAYHASPKVLYRRRRCNGHHSRYRWTQHPGRRGHIPRSGRLQRPPPLSPALFRSSGPWPPACPACPAAPSRLGSPGASCPPPFRAPWVRPQHWPIYRSFRPRCSEIKPFAAKRPQ